MITVCINDVKTEYNFKRQLIDNILENKLPMDIVKYRGKEYIVVNGKYGHCECYPYGFNVDLEEIK